MCRRRPAGVREEILYVWPADLLDRQTLIAHPCLECLSDDAVLAKRGLGPPEPAKPFLVGGEERGGSISGC